jgi:hypothetical protein
MNLHRKSSVARHLLVAAAAIPLFANPGKALAAAGTGFRYWDVNDTATIPKTLSAMGLYTDIAAAKKSMIANAYHFEVNSPLFSDNAHKGRWVLLKPGSGAIQYEEKNDYWGYPDSAVFIKNFAIDTVPGDTTTRLLWETRIMVNRKETVDSATGRKMDYWYGYSYKWQRDGKDARLVDLEGADDAIKVFPNGRSQPGVMKKWRFPSRGQCATCHRMGYADTVHGRSVLGFFTAQLNRPHPDVAGINQLEYFFQKGVLKGVKTPDWSAGTVPHWRGIDDNAASVDVRARSYIAANCSGCHGRRGLATSATYGSELNYDFYTMQPMMEFRHKSTSWQFGLDTVPPAGQPRKADDKYFYPKTGDGNNPTGLDSLEIQPALVVPGYPEKSVILHRQLARNTTPGNYDRATDQMPPLGTFEVNVAATALIEKWIKDMPRIAAPIPAPIPDAGIFHAYAVRSNLKGPAFRDNQVILPMELAVAGPVKVTVTGIDGRTMILAQVSRTAYALPSRLRPGVYLIKVNGKRFTQYLF